MWSAVAEWLGCRTLNQWVRIPAKARRGICEQVGSNPGEGTAWYL
jgi:hypothetical protein